MLLGGPPLLVGQAFERITGLLAWIRGGPGADHWVGPMEESFSRVAGRGADLRGMETELDLLVLVGTQVDPGPGSWAVEGSPWEG